MKMSPPIILLTGPSGAGKSTIAHILLTKRPIRLKKFVTYTTRPKRPGERNGTDYWFVTRTTFEEDIAQNVFFEWANVYGNYYGSSRREMERQLKGRTPILIVIDVQGMRTLKKLYPNTFVIFLDAPRENLRHRLEERGNDLKDLKRRLATIAKEERLKRLADIVIVNEEGKLPQTVARVVRVIRRAVAAS